MAVSMGGALGRLRASVGRIGSAIGSALRAGLGEFQWQPPPWWRQAGVHFGQLQALVRRYPRHSGLAISAVALLLLGGYAGWRWYQSLPKPVEYEVAVTNPARTCIECTPPGKPNSVLFTFSGSVAPLGDTGKVIEARKAGLTVSPAVSGEWKWRDDHTLVFTPVAEWPYGQRYRVEFARHGFTAPQAHLSQYQINFDAPAFIASIDTNEFYQDPVVATDKKIVSTLQFTQPVDAASLEKRVQLKLYAKVTDDREAEQSPAPTYTITYDKLKLHAYVRSSQLAVMSKGGRVELRIDKGVHALSGGNQTPEPMPASVAVPGLYSLAVTNMNLTIARDERDTPSQALVIETSQSVTAPEMSSRVKAWVLPTKHPDATMQAAWEKQARNRPYYWSTTMVTPEVLASAEPLPLQYVANEREHVEVHSFSLKGDPRRQVYVRVDKALRSFGGYLMANPVDRVLTIPEYPREVHIAYQGSLLALSGPRKLLLLTRDVPALRVELGRLLPDQLQHLVTQSGGDFAHPSFSHYQFDEANIAERFVDIVRVPMLPAGAANYQSLDLGPYLNKPGANRQGIFFLKVQAYDPQHKRVIQPNGTDGAVEDTRLIVMTDLGLIAKKSVDGSQDVFVQSIASGEPVAGASVQIIGRNGEAVGTETSDAAGHVHFPDSRSYKNEREPVLYLAKRGGDSAFLPIKGHVDALDLSRFDVGGVSNKTERAALSAFLFSDRGIYRPGDEIRAAAIVKTQDWRRLPEGLPLRIEITDPRGLAIKRELVHLDAAGFEEIYYRTRETAAVGSYAINVYVVKGEYREDLIGSMSVKVQEFLPDRLRMKTRFSTEQSEGWVSPEKLQALVTLENLFGTPAAGRRLRGSMVLSPAQVAFARYPDYQFRDPQAARDGFREALAELTTGDDGHAAFDLNLNRFARATYRVGLVVQGFEADSGRAVTSEATQLVSSLPFLLGWKADGRLDYISRGSARAIDLVAIDPRLARVAAQGLVLKRLERRYVSVLLKQDSGVYKYESRLKEAPIDEQPLSLPGGKASLPLDTATPGNYSYLVSDGAGHWPDHHRARSCLCLAVVQDHDHELGADHQGACGPRGQWLRERQFRA